MKKKLIFNILGVLVTVLAIGYFLLVAVRNAAALPAIEWDWSVYLGFGGSLLLYVVTILIASYAWFLLLRGLGEPTCAMQSLVIFALANIAKYVPGNVAQLVGRVALARRYGLRVPNVMVTLLLEAAWGILSAAVTATAILLVVGRRQFGGSEVPPTWEIAVVAAIAATAPFVGLELLKRWRPGPLNKLLGPDDLVLPRKQILFLCFLLYTSTFVVMGGIATVLASYLFRAPNVPFWLITGIVTVAWVAGFATPGSPAGVGVREAILVAALGPVLGAGVAVGVSVALRVVTTLGDGMAFLMALVLQRWVPAPAKNQLG